MNTKTKLTYLITAIITAGIITYSGCGSDTTAPTTTFPTINMTKGSVIFYTNDSVDQSYKHWTTSLRSEDSVMTTDTTIAGKACVAIWDQLKDTALGVVVGIDTVYVYYDGTAGKFYQYGLMNTILKYMHQSVPAQWDVVADFSASGSWIIESNVPVTVGTTAILVNLSGAVIGGATTDTSSVNSGWIVNCYHIEMTAALTSQVGGLLLGYIYTEYYIGYASSSANPSGTVRIFIKPVNIGGGLYTSYGYDRNFDQYIIR